MNDATKLVAQARQQQKEEALNSDRFIFDETKIHRVVPFPLFFSEDALFVGVTLPEWREVVNSKGAIIGQEQREAPLLISSQKKYFRISLNTQAEMGVRFGTIPDTYPRRWSPSAIKAFLLEKSPPNNIKVVYERIREEYALHISQSEEWHSVHALWDISTYFAQLLPAFPYLELRGLRKSGKTKIMELSSCFTFNATEILTNPSAATLFREVDAKRPTLYLDEAESLFRIVAGRVEPDERVEVLNSGYKASGSVPRQEKIGNRFITTTYGTFSPKMIASINGLRDALESRAIVHITRRAADNDKRGENEIHMSSSSYQEIRNQLYLILMQEWQNVLKNYDALEKASTGLKKRDFQLWRPLLSIAKLIDQSLYDQVLKFAMRQVEVSKIGEVGEGSFEYRLLHEAWRLLNEGYTFLYLSDLEKSLPVESKLSRKSMARLLDNFGLLEHKRTRNLGTGYEITASDFRMLIEPILPSIFSSLSSLSSPSDSSHDGKGQIFVAQEVKDCEEKASESEDRNSQTGEGSEGNEGNEGVLITHTPFSARYSKLMKAITKLYQKKQKPILITELKSMNKYCDDAFIASAISNGDLSEIRSGEIIPIV